MIEARFTRSDLARINDRVREYLNSRLDRDSLDIAKLYQASREQLAAHIRGIYDMYLGAEPTFVRARTSGAMRRIQDAIDAQIDRLTQEIGQASIRRTAELLNTQPRTVTGLYRRLFPEYEALPVSSATVLGELTTSVIGGATFEDRLLHMQDGFKQSLISTVKQSLINGEDFTALRGKMLKAFGVDKLRAPKGSAYGSVKLYKNEARRQWNMLMRQQGKKAKAKLVWWAMLGDPATTPGCLARHCLEIDELGEAPPRHYNCRCTVALFDPEDDLTEERRQATMLLKADGWTRGEALLEEADFDPAEHPRGKGGKFAKGAGKPAKPSIADQAAEAADDPDKLGALHDRVKMHGADEVGEEPSLEFIRERARNVSHLINAVDAHVTANQSVFDLTTYGETKADIDRARSLVRGVLSRASMSEEEDTEEALQMMHGIIQHTLGGRTMEAWDPAEHPRGAGGKFGAKGAGEPAEDDLSKSKGWNPSAEIARQAYGRTEDWEDRFANEIQHVDASLIDRTQSMIGQSRVGHYVQQLKDDPASVAPIMLSWDPTTERYEVLEGNHRYEAAKQLGIKLMPAIVFMPEGGEIIRRPRESAGWAWGREMLKPAIRVTEVQHREGTSYQTVPWRMMPQVGLGLVQREAWREDPRDVLATDRPDVVLIRRPRGSQSIEVLTWTGWREARPTVRPIETATGFADDSDAIQAPWDQLEQKFPVAVTSRWPVLAPYLIPRYPDGIYMVGLLPQRQAEMLTLDKLDSGEVSWTSDPDFNVAVMKALWRHGHPGDPYLVVSHMTRENVWGIDLIIGLANGQVLKSPEQFDPALTSPYRRVAAVVLERDGRIWAVLPQTMMQWVLPGGHIEPGEQPADAATREMEEETGLPVRVERFIGTLYRPWSSTDIFLCRPAGPESDIDTPEEIQAAMAVDFKDLAADERLFLTRNGINPRWIEAAFDPAEHPRGASGTTHGGEFVKKGAGAGEQQELKAVDPKYINPQYIPGGEIGGEWTPRGALPSSVSVVQIKPGLQAKVQTRAVKTLEQLPREHINWVVAQGRLERVSLTDRAPVAGGGSAYGRWMGGNTLVVSAGRWVRNNDDVAATVAHEFGHALSTAKFESQGSPMLRAFDTAVGHERVSDYAKPAAGRRPSENLGEAFAEAYAMYATRGGREAMEQLHPRTHAFMKGLFENFAKSPKAF